VSLHDAEVQVVRLERPGPTLIVELKLAQLLPLPHGTRLRFSEISDLRLEDFNQQNVLFDVDVQQGDDGVYDVVLVSSYGLSGIFRCVRIDAERI